jgi:antitoxin component HigA of HigAB toxin-antitoxin module
MKKTSRPVQFADLPADYAGLCRRHLPRPIRDDIDYTNTTEITDALAGHDLTPDQADYFDLLCGLIEDYDQERMPRRARSGTGLAALKHLLAEHDMTAAELARLLGVHRTLGAMILRGERQLTLAHVRTLARHFSVSPALFIMDRAD